MLCTTVLTENFLLTGGRDGHLNIWQVGDYDMIKLIPAHEWAIYDIVYSPNSNLFATASRDKTLKNLGFENI